MNQFENDPRLKNLMPLKRQNRELQKRNLSFSKEESNLIMDIMMEQASPAERQKIAMFRNFL